MISYRVGKFLESAVDISIGVVVGVIIIVGGFLTYDRYFSLEARDNHIRAIFKKLTTKTGQIQDTPHLIIEENGAINAYTDGVKVVLFRGMVDYAKNDDEIALVLAHELAHVMLRHVVFPEFQANELETSIAEANADKMGALYMIKAGFSVCTGREIWKRFSQDAGNYQGRDHPTHSYRYDELNVQCE